MTRLSVFWEARNDVPRSLRWFRWSVAGGGLRGRVRDRAAGCVQGATHEMEGTGGAAGPGMGGTTSGTGGSGSGRHGLGQRRQRPAAAARPAREARPAAAARPARRRDGSGGATGAAGQTGTGQPAILTAFTDDFEDGSFTAPPAKWLWTVRSDGDMAQWAITTDGTKVASQSLAADETELVSGDYRWTDSAIEAKVKLMTPDARAGVCVRWKNVDNKYCVYLEQLADNGGGVANWTMELRMRSDLGSASSLPKVETKDLTTADPGVAHRLEHGEARGARQHVHRVAERHDGVPVRRHREPGHHRRHRAGDQQRRHRRVRRRRYAVPF